MNGVNLTRGPGAIRRLGRGMDDRRADPASAERTGASHQRTRAARSLGAAVRPVTGVVQRNQRRTDVLRTPEAPVKDAGRPVALSADDLVDVVAEVAAGGVEAPGRLLDVPKEFEELVVGRVGRRAAVIDQDLEPEGPGVDAQQLAVRPEPPRRTGAHDQ